MKKIVAILLSFLLVLSLTACGNNILEFEATGLTVQIMETGEELIGSDENVEGVLKVNLDDNKIEYNLGRGTYYGKLKEFNEPVANGAGTGYNIEWNETPEVLADFEVYSSCVGLFSANEIVDEMAFLMFYVERPGYYDLIVNYEWIIKE